MGSRHLAPITETVNPEDTRDIRYHKASGKMQVSVWSPLTRRSVYGGIHKVLADAQRARNRIVRQILSDEAKLRHLD